MNNRLDERPLAFIRMSFGALMMVYSAGKCSEDHIHNRELGLSFNSFDKRVPSGLHSVLVVDFPWFTRQELYWRLHAPLMLLCATGITLGFGRISRVCSLLFFVLKIVLTLQTQHTYNNHEYLYALIALLLFITPGHDVRHSFIGKMVMETLESKQGTAIVSSAFATSMLLIGITYMMLQNAVYGIAGIVAPLGMGLLVWPSIVLLLGRSDSSAGLDDSDKSGTISLYSFLMRLFFSIIYFYAGVAKTGHDWLSGSTARELMRLWTGPTASLLVDALWGGCGGGGGGSHNEVLFIKCMVWGGLMLDLSAIVGLNLAMDGRGVSKAVFAGLIGAFHLSNHFLFIIETFPWVMMSALAVHFDSSWMDICAQRSSVLLRPLLSGKLGVAAVTISATLLKALMVVSAVSLVAFHVGAPLPCAIHSLYEDGSLTWGSQCQYWSWRMMTRSTRALPVGLLMRGTARDGGGREWVRETGLRGVWQEAAAYEDRLLSLVHNYRGLRGQGPNGTNIGAQLRHGYVDDCEKFADVWVEVNGPPFQRYVHPNVDLSKQRIERLGGFTAVAQRYMRDLWQRPQPLASWVMPRITTVRSQEWRHVFRTYESRVKEKKDQCQGTSSGSEGGGTTCIPATEEVEVVFLADTRDSRPLQISSLVDNEAEAACNGARFLEVQLLGGHAHVLNLDSSPEVASGACLRLQGELVLRAVGDAPLVLAVVMPRENPRCSPLYKKLRVSSAVEGPFSSPSTLLLAHAPNATTTTATATTVATAISYPPAFKHCQDINTLSI